MMTKTVCTKRILLSKIALLPLFSGLIFFICIKSVAQEKSITPPKNTSQTEKNITQPAETKSITFEKNEIFSVSKVTEKPTFPGGIEQFYRFIGANFKAPSEPNLKGKVYITFVIEKDGSLSDIKSIRDIGFGTGDEAIRVLKLCPKWIPAKIDENPVRVLYSLPITISTPQNEKSIAPPFETKTIETQENKIYKLAELSEKPGFPGGIERFYQFIGTNFKAPSEPNLKGKVYISFVIEKDGSLSNFKNIRDIGFGTGDEAIRVLKLSPKWIPALIDNLPVRASYALPISIQSAN